MNNRRLTIKSTCQNTFSRAKESLVICRRNIEALSELNVGITEAKKALKEMLPQMPDAEKKFDSSLMYPKTATISTFNNNQMKNPNTATKSIQEVKRTRSGTTLSLYSNRREGKSL